MNKKSLNLGLLFLRIGTSASIFFHGYGKLIKILTGDFSFGDPIGIRSTASLILCAFAEFITPIFIALGSKTRWFSVIAS